MCPIDEQAIKDKLTKTCPCTQVTKAKIKEVIQAGATSLESIKEKTGAMTGCCKGRRCKASIEGLLREARAQEQ